MRLFSLIACTSVSMSISFSIDPAFTPSEQEEIKRAAGAWNTIAKDHITFDGASWHIVKRDPGPGRPNGLCQSGQRLVLIRPEPYGATTYAVAIHEFGHVLGLGHVAAGVMNPVNASTQFTDQDLTECRRVGACEE